MSALSLIRSSSDAWVDATLQGIVGLFELTFPDRVSGYYLTGSYSEGAAIPGSDIDLLVLFKGQLQDEEERIVRQLVERCARTSPVELDVEPLSEPIPYPLRVVSLKLGSRLIYGEDTRHSIPLPPLEAYTQHAMDLASRLLRRLHGRAGSLTPPLGYPEPQQEFYGFVAPTATASGEESGSTKELVVATGLAATALLAYRAGRYVSGKRDCIRQYQEAFPDEWGAFLEELSTCCRDRWGYQVPSEPEQRRRLRELCERALRFQNRFLEICRDFSIAGGGETGHSLP